MLRDNSTGIVGYAGDASFDYSDDGEVRFKDNKDNKLRAASEQGMGKAEPRRHPSKWRDRSECQKRELRLLELR